MGHRPGQEDKRIPKLSSNGSLREIDCVKTSQIVVIENTKVRLPQSSAASKAGRQSLG